VFTKFVNALNAKRRFNEVGTVDKNIFDIDKDVSDRWTMRGILIFIIVLFIMLFIVVISNQAMSFKTGLYSSPYFEEKRTYP